ncbi:MAG TPA: nucleotidyltransferase domain-containing protein [Phycisphaerae bacterium]|nr:nucleotidyltransferase domain-containing protein [Phycisphaerae bacterium]
MDKTPIRKVLSGLTSIDGVKAVSLAGSLATGTDDEYSDIDMQCYVSADIPGIEERKRAYESIEAGSAGLLDNPVGAEFEDPPHNNSAVVDWLRVTDVKCDVLWIRTDELKRVIDRLPGDLEQRETAAKLLHPCRSLWDPQDVLAKMVRNLPEYSVDRALKKAGGLLGRTRWFLCEWGVLAKCARREDVVAYQKAESQMVETLVSALYALNRNWYPGVRKLRHYCQDLEVLPDAFVQRLESMILRQDDCSNLANCEAEMRSLFRDLAKVAVQRYPQWRPPRDWAIWQGQQPF